MKLDLVEVALSCLTEAELVAIAEATYAKPAPTGTEGLMGWIESAVDVERHRRSGIELPLSPPSAAIDESEEVTAIQGAIALRATGAGGGGDPPSPAAISIRWNRARHTLPIDP